VKIMTSSILCHSYDMLHVIHLDHSPAVPTIESGATVHNAPLVAFHPHGVYIVTAHHGESAITIINLHSQTPSHSQFIDTGLGILAIVLTGNVLLVKGSDAVVAWLLTEEGVVGGTFGQRRVDRNNSLWNMPYQVHPNLLSQQKEENSGDDDGNLDFLVEGEIVVIRQCGDPIHLYHTNTGEILNLDRVHQGACYYFTSTGPWSGCDLYHMYTTECYEHPDCGWPVSETNLQEGCEGPRREAPVMVAPPLEVVLGLHAVARSGYNPATPNLI